MGIPPTSSCKSISCPCNRGDMIRFVNNVIVSLFLVSLLPLLASRSSSSSSSCRPDQAQALLRFKNSSISPPLQPRCFRRPPTKYSHPPPSISSIRFPSPKTASWREDQDCCSWEGVSCDNSTGYVVGLDLTCVGLQGSIPSSSPLFSLHRLRSLNLAGNNLFGSTIPPEINVFSQMTHLNLSFAGVSGTVPTEISQLSKLVSLDLSDNFGLAMDDPTMRMLVRNLTQLEQLHLSFVNMSTVTPTSLMNLSSSLTSLDLSECSLRGKFPEYVFAMPNLQNLDLSGNYLLTGTLPEFSWSPNLAFLSLSGCGFTGGVPNSIGNLSQLTSLDLSYNNLTVDLDSETFSTLQNLRSLSLSGLSISGESKDIVSFPHLQTLVMDDCNLRNFPLFLSQSKKLIELQLIGNMIEEIPSWFWGFGIDTLERLYLSENIIKGEFRLPWKRLSVLDLRENSFEGTLPDLPPSMQLFQANGNHFNGSIPRSICRLTSLGLLDLHENNLTGVIPQCLGNLTSLQQLQLNDNSFTGSLPSSLANCTSLQTLDISYNSISSPPPTWISALPLDYVNLKANNFVGRWPQSFFRNTTSFGYTIDLSDNKFEGAFPLPPYIMFYYSVSNNSFSGEISPLLCNTSLRILDLSNNGLTGTLPGCLNETIIDLDLEYLNIRGNRFSGLIPEIFQGGSFMRSLDLSGNEFEGPLPRSLSKCSQLEVLDVGSNKIVDSFPDWLGHLPLKVLSLRSNKFHGHVSVFESTRNFSKVRVLDLSNNGFEGKLTDDFIAEMLGMAQEGDHDSSGPYMSPNFSSSIYYSVTLDLKGIETEMVKINVEFAMLDLSSNRFHGEIPVSIGSLKLLRGLNLSHNSFTGTIPPSVGKLTNLESLDLSSNNLEGEIPKEMVELSFLGFLNLSRNNLEGPIPVGGQLNTFSNSSFEGNPGLCGIPLTRSCIPVKEGAQPGSVEEEDSGGWLVWTFVAMGLGSGMGLGITLGYMVLEMGRPLWLARMVIRLEAVCKKRSKRKRNARR